MIDTTKIKGLLFDYGGTIDSNGLHWAEVIWQGYEALQVPVSKEYFRNAYVYGERTLGKNPIVQPHHTFLDMLRLKCDLQIQWLQQEGRALQQELVDRYQEKIVGFSTLLEEIALNE